MVVAQSVVAVAVARPAGVVEEGGGLTVISLVSVFISHPMQLSCSF